MDGEDTKVQHGMTEAHQAEYAMLVKGVKHCGRYELETVRVTHEKEVGNNLREVYAKKVADFLDEQGLGEKAARMAYGMRIMARNGMKISNPESTGGGGTFVPTEFQEHIRMQYITWSREVIRRFGHLQFDATMDVIGRGMSFSFAEQKLKGMGAKTVIAKCLMVSA